VPQALHLLAALQKHLERAFCLYAPGHPEQQQQDAGRQESLAHNLDDELRETVGQRGLPLARRRCARSSRPACERCEKTGRAQSNDRPGRRGAHWSPSSQVLAQVDGPQRHDLLNQGDADEKKRIPDQPLGRASRLGRIEERPHDLGVDQLEADAGQEQHCQHRDTESLGLQLAPQQDRIFAERDLHRTSFLAAILAQPNRSVKPFHAPPSEDGMYCVATWRRAATEGSAGTVVVSRA